MNRAEEERREHAKQEEEKGRKEEELAKEREAEGDKIWEERLGRQRRREACQALGMIRNRSQMKFHKFLQQAACTLRHKAAMDRLQAEGKKGGRRYASMLRMWMERLTLQGPLPKETLWNCVFCRYDLPRISFKDSPPFFPIFIHCLLGSLSIAW